MRASLLPDLRSEFQRAGKENLAMFIPSTIRLSTGNSAVFTRPMIRVTVTPHELHQLVLTLEREADAARAESRHNVADSLDWRASALRESAR